MLKAIAVFKLVKTLLLIAVGLGSWELLRPAAADVAERWASALAWRLGPRASAAVDHKLSGLHDSQLRVVGIVAILYAGLFAVKGSACGSRSGGRNT